MLNFLTAEEQNSLKSLHRAEKNRRNADRIKAVLLSDKGWTFRQISEALFMKSIHYKVHENNIQNSMRRSLKNLLHATLVSTVFLSVPILATSTLHVIIKHKPSNHRKVKVFLNRHCVLSCFL